MIAWALLLVTVAVLAWISWLGWGEPIIDFGRDVYVPWQLRAGRVLYRTLSYNYGPVAPYVLAGVTALFGDTLKVFAGFGAAIGVATMAALYLLGTRLANAAVGFAAALMFAVHSFFGYTTWGTNYVMPYAYAATLSMALALWSLLALIVYVERRRALVFYVGLFAMLAAVLTKQEVGAAIVAVWISAAVIHRVQRREVFGGLVAAAAIAALVLVAFAARTGEHAMLAENVLKFARGSSASVYSDIAGFGRWRFSPFDQSAYVSALPVGIALLVSSGIRRPVWLVALFMLGCAARIVLAYTPSWYGFYLFVPGYLVMAAASWIWLSKYKVALATLTILAAVIGWRSVAAGAAVYAAKTEVLDTGKGVMRDDPTGRVAAIEEFAEYLRLHGGPSDTMIVLPEGALLNWMTGLRNPTAYYNFIPPEVSDTTTEQRIVAEVEESKPTFVTVVSRSLSEFGQQDFSYMPLLMGDIQTHYTLVTQFGDPSGRLFRLALLKRIQ